MIKNIDKLHRDILKEFDAQTCNAVALIPRTVHQELTSSVWHMIKKQLCAFRSRLVMYDLDTCPPTPPVLSFQDLVLPLLDDSMPYETYQCLEESINEEALVTGFGMFLQMSKDNKRKHLNLLIDEVEAAIAETTSRRTKSYEENSIWCKEITLATIVEIAAGGNQFNRGEYATCVHRAVETLTSIPLWDGDWSHLASQITPTNSGYPNPLDGTYLFAIDAETKRYFAQLQCLQRCWNIFSVYPEG